MTLVQTDQKARRGRTRTATLGLNAVNGTSSLTSTSQVQTLGVALPGEKERADELSKWALTLVLVGSFMVVLDFSIVNVALPSIHRALGFGGNSVTAPAKAPGSAKLLLRLSRRRL